MADRKTGNMEPGSSVSIVSGYRLDDQAIQVWSLADSKDFSSNLLSPDWLWGPTQAPVQWALEVLSLGVKPGRGVMLTIHPHLVPRS
jgi:hypothetical protein